MKNGARKTLWTSIRIVIVVLFAISFLHSLEARQSVNKSEEADKAAVIKIDEEFNNAVLQKDTEALQTILADRLSWIARGDRIGKVQVIADIGSANLHFKSLTHDQIEINLFNDTAVVTGHSTSILEYKGKLFTAPRLFTTVYMKLDGRWQMVAHQVSDLTGKSDGKS